MYRTVFTVRGKINFPLDMLRYDRCTPYMQHDVYAIGEPTTEDRDVNLVAYHKYKKSPIPTIARWASFGWKVVLVRPPDKAV